MYMQAQHGHLDAEFLKYFFLLFSPFDTPTIVNL